LSESYARELMRRIQNLRRKAGMQKSDKVELCVVADVELMKYFDKWQGEISERCGVSKFDICSELECKLEGDSSVEKIKGHEITLCLSKK